MNSSICHNADLRDMLLTAATHSSGTTETPADGLVVVDCPRRQRQIDALRERHWTMLIVSVGIMIFAPLLSLKPTGQVTASWLSISGLPPMCGSRVIAGIECPGCGLTRSFVALGGGDLAASFRFHRIGWLMALAVMLQVPYRILMLRELRTKLPNRTWPVYFGISLITALIVNWLLKIISTV